MLKQMAYAGVLTLALAGIPSISSAEQGRGGGQKAHVAKAKQKDQGNRGQGKAKGVAKAKSNTKAKGNSNRGADDGVWTSEQRTRYTRMLPAGMTLEQASAGFANRGLFIAALNASREHNVSFVQLKQLMVGEGMSLGEALRTLGR